MKKILLLASLFTVTLMYGQAPQKLNYQAIVRDASGKELTKDKEVSLKFLIHNLTANGTVVFQEEGKATTNQFGLITYKIGTNGNLAAIDWSNGEKYLQVMVDVNNGTNYADMGTSQLLSVPYALFAANSLAGPPGATGPTGATGPAGPTGSGGGPTGPIGCTNANSVLKSDGTSATCSIITDNGTNVGIGATGPTEKLDVNGNIKFNGALMPADSAGRSGQVLMSQGAGIPPVWAFASTTITSAAGSGALLANNSVLAYTTLPGLSATITIPAGTSGKVFIQTDGGVQLNSAARDTTGFSDIAIFIDGTQAGSGRRIPAWNIGNTIYSVNTYSFSTLATLSPGVHTITVRAKKYNALFADCYVSASSAGSPGGGSPPIQGTLNVVQFP